METLQKRSFCFSAVIHLLWFGAGQFLEEKLQKATNFQQCSVKLFLMLDFFSFLVGGFLKCRFRGWGNKEATLCLFSGYTNVPLISVITIIFLGSCLFSYIMYWTSLCFICCHVVDLTASISHDLVCIPSLDCLTIPISVEKFLCYFLTTSTRQIFILFVKQTIKNWYLSHLKRALEEKKSARAEAKNSERAAMQCFQERSSTVEVYLKVFLFDCFSFFGDAILLWHVM